MSEPVCTAQPRERAAARKAVISVFITTSPTNVLAARRDTSIGIASPALMPIGVAFTTRSKLAGSFDVVPTFSAGHDIAKSYAAEPTAFEKTWPITKALVSSEIVH